MYTRRSSIGIFFLTVLIDLIGFGIVIPVLPLYAEKLGATAWQIGLLVGVYSFAQLIFSPIWG
jgi:MFS family permease